ncbi:TadE/TadG family type IV pilus assembly protein [Marivita lacus]|uniref:TadE/TadG family type IV pilus assembly protein n=1 Tax=Marivita lacus TaxID=1323742 RepID=UPI003570ED25
MVFGLSIPIILGFGALTIEYGGALVKRSENQRTSDIAAYTAAFEYKRKKSEQTDQKINAAKSAATPSRPSMV